MAILIDAMTDGAARRICAAYGDRPDALLEILNAMQEEKGWLSDEALRTIADALNISRAEIHGVVSFYHDYHREPPALHMIKLCRAEACQAVGSEELAAHTESKLKIRTGEKTTDGAIALEAVYCLGNCALGPAAMIDGDLMARMTPEKIDAHIEAMENRE